MEKEINYTYSESYILWLNKQRKYPVEQILADNKLRSFNEISDILAKKYHFNFKEGELDRDYFDNLSFKDKANYLDYLLKLYKLSNDPDFKKMLLKNIEEIKDELESNVDSKDEKKKEEPKEEDKEASKAKEPTDPRVRAKAKLYGDFAYQRSLDENFKATKAPTISNKKFDNMSRRELVGMYSPEKFYSLSDSERAALFQATVNEYLISNGVEPCAVSMVPLHFDDKTVINGEYVPALGEILLNTALFNNIDAYSEVNNRYFPLQILQTLIHEAQHRVQFQNIDQPEKSLADKEIKRSLKVPQSGLTFAEYLAEPDELDARNAALAYFREAAVESGNDDLAAFYNLQKKHELSNGKASGTSSALQNELKDVFNPKMFDVDITRTNMMSSSQKESVDIRNNGLEMARARRFSSY